MNDGLVVVVMTRNEATNIAACLDSLASFSLIYVVDDHSTDGTAGIAAEKGAQIIPFIWNGQYPRKKQWCLNNIAPDYPWVLFVDADERMTPALAQAVHVACKTGNAAYYVRSRWVWQGRCLRYGAIYRKIALMRRDKVHFPDIDDATSMGDWSVEGHIQPVINNSGGGRIGILPGYLLHDDQKGFSAWLDRHNRYSDWEALINPDWSHEGRWRAMLKHVRARLPARPLWGFIHDYVWRLGFLDGQAGLDAALARAFYAWQIGVKRRAISATSRVPHDGSIG